MTFFFLTLESISFIMLAETSTFDAQLYRLEIDDLRGDGRWMEKARAASTEIRDRFSAFLDLTPIKYFLTACDTYLENRYPNSQILFNQRLDDAAACLNGGGERVK
jgi:hypothetical protein